MLVHVWGVAYAAGTLCICVCNSLPDVSWRKQLFSACCMKQLQKLETERSYIYSLPHWGVAIHRERLKGGELICIPQEPQVSYSLSDFSFYVNK